MGINYKMIYEANKIYGEKYKKYNVAWINAQRIQWNKLNELSDLIIEKEVLKYLNGLGCRIQITDEVTQGIKNAHLATIPYIDAIRNEDLWNLELDKEIIVYTQQITLGHAIYAVFDTFSNIGHHFSHVAASKLLHQINPFIFMMWDKGIVGHYGVRKNSEDYVYRFLPLMKEKLNRVIQSYMDDFSVDRTEAIAQLNSYRNHKTVLKLLDEYNWLIIRKLIPASCEQSAASEISIQPTSL